MAHDTTACGSWLLAAPNSAVLIPSTFGFGKPQSPRDWRSFGAFGASIIALFAEIYGFPLAILLLFDWLQTRYPGVETSSHGAAQLWMALFGVTSNPHVTILHLFNVGLIGVGFILLSATWHVLHAAQAGGHLTAAGSYARARHPHYIGFIAILSEFLPQQQIVERTGGMSRCGVVGFGQSRNRNAQKARSATRAAPN